MGEIPLADTHYRRFRLGDARGLPVSVDGSLCDAEIVCDLLRRPALGGEVDCAFPPVHRHPDL